MVIKNSLIIVPNLHEAQKWYQGIVIIYYNEPEYTERLHMYRYDKLFFELVDNPVEEFSNWSYSLQNTIEKADYLSVTAKEMGKYMEKYSRRYKTISNGANYNLFKQASVKLQKPSDFPNTNKPIIGYYGAHASWVDWDLIIKIAELTNIHVVMIGKQDKPPYNMCREHKNITYLPIKPHEELVNYLSHFDICMIPFSLKEMIKGCDPVKFYEYISAGKPVIATNMVELKKYSSCCYFMDHSNYHIVINQALDEKDNQELIKKRQEMAMNNTWDSRADDIMSLIV